MDHDHGHWFVVGVLGAGVLLAAGLVLRSLAAALGAMILEAAVGPSAFSFWAALLVLAGALAWRARCS